MANTVYISCGKRERQRKQNMLEIANDDGDIYVDTIETLLKLKEKGPSYLRRISHLDLDTRNIGNNEVTIILSVIEDLKVGRLKYLNLSHNRNLKNRWIALILRALVSSSVFPIESFSSLKNLWITEAEEAIVREEMANPNIKRCRLEYIYLDNCNITCPPFLKNPFLKTSISELGSIDFQMILKALSIFSPYLKRLSLSENQAFATPIGLKALMPIMTSMKYLTSFSLCRLKWVASHGTDFSSQLTEQLISLLPHLPSLKKIDLRQDCLTKNDIEKIAGILPFTFLHDTDLSVNPGLTGYPIADIQSILQDNKTKSDVIIHSVMMEVIFDKLNYKHYEMCNRLRRSPNYSSRWWSAANEYTLWDDHDLLTKAGGRGRLEADVECHMDRRIISREDTTLSRSIPSTVVVEKKEAAKTPENSLRIPLHLVYYEILPYLDSNSFSEQAHLEYYKTFMFYKLLQKNRLKNIASKKSCLGEERIKKYSYENKANKIFEDMKEQLSKSIMLDSPKRKTLKDLRSRITANYHCENKFSNMILRFESLYDRSVHLRSTQGPI